MQVSQAVKAFLEYHQANSEKKHYERLSFCALPVQERIWQEKDRSDYFRGDLFLSR